MLDVTTIEAQAIISVAIVIALVEAVKRAWNELSGSEFKPGLLPVIAIALGIAYHAFITVGDWRAIILAGIIAGLVASGLYSGSKAFVGK